MVEIGSDGAIVESSHPDDVISLRSWMMVMYGVRISPCL